MGELLTFALERVAWFAYCSLSLPPFFCVRASQNGYCHYNQSHFVAKLSGYVNVTSGNVTALKAAIYKHGPVSVSIDASHKTFSFYSSGVYYEPKCGESWFSSEGFSSPVALQHFRCFRKTRPSGP